MSEWRQVTLGDLLHVKHGFAFKGEFFRDSGDLIVLTPGNFNETGGFKGKAGKEKYYDGPVPAEYLLERGDVVIAMTEQSLGLLGSSATMPESGRYLHNQRLGLLRIVDNDALDMRFAYHLFNSPEVRAQIQATATGAKVRHTAPERIGRVVVRVPSLEDQQVIAGVLDSADDLIESCRRRIAVLEQTAHEIYREWFVHFRYPGHADDDLVGSNIGLVPAGWDVMPVAEAVEINPRVRGTRGDEVPFVAMADLSNDSMVVRPNGSRTFGGGGSRFQQHDTLFARITPCTENGKTGFVQFLGPGKVAMGSTEFIVFRARRLSAYSTYCLARRDDLRRHAIASMAGASGRQRVRNECFQSFVIAASPKALQQLFAAAVEPIFRSCESLTEQGQRLTALRDVLLPKLVTGAIDVSQLDLDALLDQTAA